MKTPPRGVLQGGRTHRDSAIIFCGIKTETSIYQCFRFTETAKNAVFGSLLLRSDHNSDKWNFTLGYFAKRL